MPLNWTLTTYTLSPSLFLTEKDEGDERVSPIESSSVRMWWTKYTY